MPPYYGYHQPREGMTTATTKKGKKIKNLQVITGLYSLGMQVTVPSYIKLHLNSDVKVTWK